MFLNRCVGEWPGRMLVDEALNGFQVRMQLRQSKRQTHSMAPFATDLFTEFLRFTCANQLPRDSGQCTHCGKRVRVQVPRDADVVGGEEPLAQSVWILLCTLFWENHSLVEHQREELVPKVCRLIIRTLHHDIFHALETEGEC